MRQGSGPSREEVAFAKARQADRLEEAAIYGLVGLKPHVVVNHDLLDELRSHVPQESVPQVLHDPPTCKPRHSKSSGGRGFVQHFTPPKEPHDTQPGQSQDLLALLVPTADPDAYDHGKHSPNLTEKQLQILGKVTSAAHDMLRKSPHSILNLGLKELRKKGNETLALTMSPWLLAIGSGSQQKLRHALAALDIEKFATCIGVEKWPQYAKHAADGGMNPVIPVAEIGYATEQATKAWKVLATLRRKQEAMSGRMETGEASKQYGPDTNLKGLNINKSVVNNFEDPSRKLEEVETAELAYQLCMAELVGKLKLAYNSTGFDERALFKIQLIAKANLPKGHHRAAKAVWEAGKQLLDKAREVPAFLPAFQPVRQLLKVLWNVLEQNLQYKALMERAGNAGLRRMSGTLDQAFKVRFVGKHSGIQQMYKHAASFAFVSFSRANMETLVCS